MLVPERRAPRPSGASGRSARTLFVSRRLPSRCTHGAIRSFVTRHAAHRPPWPDGSADYPRRLRRLGDRRRRLVVRLGRAGRPRVGRRHPPRRRARRQLDRHGRGLRPRPLRGGRRPRARAICPRDRPSLRVHQVRAGLGSAGSTRSQAPAASGRPTASAARSRRRCAGWGSNGSTSTRCTGRPSDGTPIEDYWGALLDLKTEGKVRAVGLSNHDADQLGAPSRSATSTRCSRRSR